MHRAARTPARRKQGTDARFLSPESMAQLWPNYGPWSAPLREPGDGGGPVHPLLACMPMRAGTTHRRLIGIRSLSPLMPEGRDLAHPHGPQTPSQASTGRRSPAGAPELPAIRPRARVRTEPPGRASGHRTEPGTVKPLRVSGSRPGFSTSPVEAPPPEVVYVDYNLPGLPPQPGSRIEPTPHHDLTIPARPPRERTVLRPPR